MANKRSPKKRRPAPKTVLRLPDLDQAKSAVLNSLSSRDAQRGYRKQWMSSLNGTARSRDYRSVEPLWSAIACTWNRGSLHPEPLICASVQYADSPTKPPIAVSLALILPPVSGG